MRKELLEEGIDVAVLMGSMSDIEKVRPCAEILDSLDIDYFITVASAHRSPGRVGHLIGLAEEFGVKAFICAAGMAAHLAGAVAAGTIRPVIGIPLSGSAMSGLDALLSTVQMPSGFPVATTAIDGAANAAWLAAQILAIHDADLAGRIRRRREEWLLKVGRDAEGIGKRLDK